MTVNKIELLLAQFPVCIALRLCVKLKHLIEGHYIRTRVEWFIYQFPYFISQQFIIIANIAL